jgi:hypothetical protein
MSLISELKGFSRVYNESSLQSGSRFSVPEHCDRFFISRFSSFQAFKSLPKVRDRSFSSGTFDCSLVLLIYFQGN